MSSDCKAADKGGQQKEVDGGQEEGDRCMRRGVGQLQEPISCAPSQCCWLPSSPDNFLVAAEGLVSVFPLIPHHSGQHSLLCFSYE